MLYASDPSCLGMTLQEYMFHSRTCGIHFLTIQYISLLRIRKDYHTSRPSSRSMRDLRQTLIRPCNHKHRQTFLNKESFAQTYDHHIDIKDWSSALFRWLYHSDDCSIAQRNTAPPGIVAQHAAVSYKIRSDHK